MLKAAKIFENPRLPTITVPADLTQSTKDRKYVVGTSGTSRVEDQKESKYNMQPKGNHQGNTNIESTQFLGKYLAIQDS